MITHRKGRDSLVTALLAAGVGMQPSDHIVRALYRQACQRLAYLIILIRSDKSRHSGGSCAMISRAMLCSSSSKLSEERTSSLIRRRAEMAHEIPPGDANQ